MRLLVARIAEHWNPFESAIWEDAAPLLRENVAYVAARLVRGAPYDATLSHTHRVAWFSRFGFRDSISIDVGLFDPADIYVEDGNHRLAAAIYRGVKWVPVNAQGSIEIIDWFRGKVSTWELLI